MQNIEALTFIQADFSYGYNVRVKKKKECLNKGEDRLGLTKTWIPWLG